MCCSLYDEDSANVDIKIAKLNNIEVRGVRDYGDEGLIEFIISELIRLLNFRTIVIGMSLKPPGFTC